VEGIGGDDAAVQRQQSKQLRHGRDLVRSVGDPQLAEHQALLARPGADQVQRRPAGLAVERAARGLAIDRHHPLHPLGEGRQIAGEATLEGHRIEPPEDPREGVAARHPARQLEEAAQQRLLAPPEQRHACPRAASPDPGVDAGLGAAQGGEQRDHHDLVQLVALGIARARVRKLGKTRPKPLHTVLPCNQDGRIRTIFLHKKTLQISNAIPLGSRAVQDASAATPGPSSADCRELAGTIRGAAGEPPGSLRVRTATPRVRPSPPQPNSPGFSDK